MKLLSISAAAVLMLASCMSTFQHEMSLASQTIPDAVRLACLKTPEARPFFALMQRDLSDMASERNPDGQAYAERLLLGLRDDTPLEVSGAATAALRTVINAYEAPFAPNDDTFALMRQVSIAIGDGLSPPPQRQPGERF